jgi:hypothetical protein
MNLLVIGIGGDQFTSEIIDRLSEHVFVDQIFGSTDITEHVSTKFAALLDCHKFESEDFSNSEYSSFIDSKLYNEIASFEGEALRMMDRLKIFQGKEGDSFTRRRIFLFRLSAFWGNFLSENRIDAVIFGNTPHEIYDFVVYGLCKKRGIRTLFFNDAGNILTSTVLIAENIEETGDLALGLKIISTFTPKSSDSHYEQIESDLNNRVQDLTGHLDAPHLQKTFDTKFEKLKLLSNFIRILSPLLHPRRTPSMQTEIFIRKKFAKSQLESIRFAKKKLTQDNYVYFPLHVQPELSTSPAGLHFAEQLEAIRFLSENIPGNWRLVVKEHPDVTMLRMSRSPNFYKSIREFANVDLLAACVSHDDLVYGAQAIATISGTPGLDAVLNGKPAWLLGYAWFQEAPGMFRVDDTRSLNDAVQACTQWTKPDSYLMRRFIHDVQRATVNATIWGAPRDLGADETEFRRRATVSNISEIIIAWISLKKTTHASEIV